MADAGDQHEVPPAPLARATALPFRALSVVRHARAFHPQGFTCTGSWTVDAASALAGDAPVLRPGARFDVVARLSRGGGFPQVVGDVFGIAVRVLDADGRGGDQDLLCNASADLPLVHHVFLPARGWCSHSYSSCLPYDAGAGRVVAGFLPPGDRSPGPELDAMRAEVTRGISFGIGLARSLGRFERVGTLRLDGVPGPAHGDLDFDVAANAAGGLRPVGLLNALRGEAYRQSRRGRGAPEAPRRTPA